MPSTLFTNGHRPEEHGPFGRAVIQKYRAELERRGQAPATTNLQLAALRKLAAEAADHGLLDPAAAGIARVRGARHAGVRAGNWLSREQAQQLLELPTSRRTKSGAIRRCSPCWSAAACGGANWPP